MINKLNRCLFCGGTVIAMQNIFSKRSGWYIYCPGCGMYWGFDDYWGGTFATQAVLTRCWNETTDAIKNRLWKKAEESIKNDRNKI